jgi:uncharacterized protein (TIGR00369 family)
MSDDGGPNGTDGGGTDGSGTDAGGDIPDGAEEALQHYFETQHQFLAWLGLEVESLEYGTAVLQIPYDEKLTNVTPEWLDADDTRDPIQGGVASTLIDVAGGIALRPYLDDPVGGSMATINLNVNYLRQATDDLTATAEVVRAGNTVGVAQILVESEVPGEGAQPVAAGMGAYRLFN